MSQTSRRNLLAALASFIAAPTVQALPAPVPIETLPPPVSPQPGDPVFAAMERWQRLEEIALDLAHTDFGAAAALDARRARLMLAQTAPTTAEGLTALTEFVGRQSRELKGDGSWFFFEPGEEANAYAASIKRASSWLEAAEASDPIFLAIERHRRAWERYGFACRYADTVDELYVAHIGEAKVREAHEAVCVAELALIGTSVTTAEGWAAVLDYEAEMESECVFFHLDGELLSDILSRKRAEGIAEPAPRRPQLTIAHSRD